MSAKDDPRHFDKIGEKLEYKIESLLGVPMVANDKVIGVLEVINKIDGEFSHEDQELLSALGAQAAVAIENSRLFQQSDLISEMVHELRTPLASISTATHLLMRPEISQEQRTSMAETIHRETNRLSELASSFLDLARLESGRSQFKVERVDLDSILNDVIEIMKNRIEEQGLTLKTEIADAHPPFNGDPDKLKQVAINLVSNAIKYNQPNGTITIGTGSSKDNITFFVKDTGRGMLPEHVESLFEKFYRVPGSEKLAPGTGLGLSIVKKIVKGHGGQVTVNSEIGVGTTFTVTIPIK
jgi:signal transduction histidine kinase